jgi:hypothetical protein
VRLPQSLCSTCSTGTHQQDNSHDPAVLPLLAFSLQDSPYRLVYMVVVIDEKRMF